MAEERGEDQLWELARRGDAAALRRAAGARPGEAHYHAQRARAFTLALEGWSGEALAALNDAWTDEGPSPPEYAADVARVHFLAGDCGAALTALQLDLRTLAHIEDVRGFATGCVARDPALWRSALRVAWRGERGTARVRAAAEVLRARRAALGGSVGDPQHDLS